VQEVVRAFREDAPVEKAAHGFDGVERDPLGALDDTGAAGRGQISDEPV